MLLTLLALILRPVSMEFRGKFKTPAQRAVWDYTLFASGLVPPLVFGVAFGNLFLGAPFYLDDMQMPHYVDSFFGSFFHLLSPFALLTGVVSVVMLASHGAVFLSAKTSGPVHKRAVKFATAGMGVWALLFVIGGAWVSRLNGYVINSPLSHVGPSDPTTKSVVLVPGAWLANYIDHPILWAVPALPLLAALVCVLLLRTRHHALAFAASGTVVAGTIGTAAVALFPFMLTSSLNPNHSFTLWDASSSHMTLWLMTIASLIFVPLILLYTSWAFHKLRGIIHTHDIEEGKRFFY
jgi:cytochrome d ubiquinol oxidase subunit II